MNDVLLRPDHFTGLLQSKPNIPAEIPRYVSHCLEFGHTNQLIEELRRDGPATAEGLDRFFEKASEVTGLSQSALLKVTGFSWRDTDPSRIESAIAQLRAIFFLDSQGFSQITPIPARGGRSSDTIATRDLVKYAVEVVNSIYRAVGRFSSQQLADWAFSRWTSEGKQAQISATSRDHSCARGAFVAVISTQPTVALQTHEDFVLAAKLAWEYIGSPSATHVCMVTGREALGYGLDDAIYPPWPAP